MWRLLVLALLASAQQNNSTAVTDTDGESSRKILGSSVVTSVSVIMDTGNGSKIYTDAVGHPVSKPQAGSDLASPIDLLHPDRYEFYTFDDSGDLIKRLMTLEEIQEIVATGDGAGFPSDAFSASGALSPEKRVDDVVNNVQTVLKEEMQNHKDLLKDKLQLDTPDVSDSWSQILPAIFENSGEDISPKPTPSHATPDTIMVEPVAVLPLDGIKESVVSSTEQISTTEKVMTLITKKPRPTTTLRTTTSSKLNVEITTNSNSTTERNNNAAPSENVPVVEIKPPTYNLELTKDNSRPIYRVSPKTTKKPLTKPAKRQTLKPVNISSTTRKPVSDIPNQSTSPLGTISQSTTTDKITPYTLTSPVKRSTTVKVSATTPTLPPTVYKLPLTSTRSTTTITGSTLSSTKAPFSSTTTEVLTTSSKILATTPQLPSITTKPPLSQLQPISLLTSASSLSSTLTVATTPIEYTTSNLEISTLNERPAPTTTQSIAIDSNSDISTEIPNTGNLPTLLAILKQSSQKPVETTTQTPTTYSGLSTFFIIADNRNKTVENTTKYILVEVSTIGAENQTKPYVVNTTPLIETTTEILEDPKHTTEPISTTPEITTEIQTTSQTKATPTWKFGDRIITSKIPETTSVLPEETTTQDLNTLSTEYVALKDIPSSKVPNSTLIEIKESTEKNTPEILEQLLLTSTNIYEINSELSKTPNDTDNEEVSTIKVIATEEPTTAPTTAPTTVPTTAPTAAPTTDLNFIDSIEQLIAQAVGNTEEPVVHDEQLAIKIQQAMTNSGNKLMNEVRNESATLASSLMNLESTTETSTIPMNLLDESFGSILSQVWGTTPEPPIVESTTEQVTESVPHIINITIIRNGNRTQPKPAKADLSLEMEYESIANEMKKNSSLALQDRLSEDDKVIGSKPANNKRSEITTALPEITTNIDLESTTENIATTVSISNYSNDNIAESIMEEKTTTFSPDYNNTQPTVVITINENITNPETEEDTTTWTLVSTVAPPGESTTRQTESTLPQQSESTTVPPPPPPVPVDLQHKPLQGFGLEDSVKNLDSDIYQFVQLCNELAFGFWKSVSLSISNTRSVIISPFAATSLLAMVFLGARGATSGEMNEILKLDDMVTFNPHLIFKNVSESIREDRGVSTAAIVRELYSDRSKGKLLGFYKERVRQFYDGHVEEVSFKEIGDVIRRRTNLLVKKHSDGKISEYLKDSFVNARPPLAGISASIFLTDCSNASTEGRDGEMYFIVLPSIRQRRLVPIPAAVWRSEFLAGYEPSIDATAAAIGGKNSIISTIFVMPGQQGVAAPGDGLARLEKHLLESSFKKGGWARLLRSLIPRPGIELQIPRFLHRSIINATNSFKKMGLHDLFDPKKADLRGLNGNAHELHLSDIVQINEFAICGEEPGVHHREVYPAAVGRRSRLLEDLEEEPRDYQRSFHDPLHDPSYLDLPLPIRPRQARLPMIPRLRFDRPFLYFIRHNPSGLILHMGRFHPRLLP